MTTMRAAVYEGKRAQRKRSKSDELKRKATKARKAGKTDRAAALRKKSRKAGKAGDKAATKHNERASKKSARSINLLKKGMLASATSKSTPGPKGTSGMKSRGDVRKKKAVRRYQRGT